MRLGNPWHGTILIYSSKKSKTRHLDDTLIILENSLHSLIAFVVGRSLAAILEVSDVPSPVHWKRLVEAVKTRASRSQSKSGPT